MAFLRWITTSKLVLILGVIVLATILTVMYYRLTAPEATATPAPTAGTPQTLDVGAAPPAMAAVAPAWTLD
ncbi:MAG: hypothetical protein ACYC5O_23080 [Anaerolineae bacterium]